MGTPVVNSTCDPAWNFSHELKGFAQGDELIFSVFDSDPMKGDDVLGKLVLPSHQFYPMGVAGEFKLDNAGKNVEAFLTINLECVAAAAAPVTSMVPMEPVVGAPMVMQGQSMFDMI